MSKKTRFLQSDGTEKLYTSARQEGTYLYFTGSGDDIANQIRGKGQALMMNNPEGALEKIVECQFMDDVYLKDGMAFWENATFGDEINMEIVLPANVPMPSEDQNGNAALVNDVVTYITASATPDATWVGDYFLFPVDYVVNRFVNDFHLMGTNYHGLILESSDTVHVPSIFKFRLRYKSENVTPNIDIKIVVSIELYREFTV